MFKSVKSPTGETQLSMILPCFSEKNPIGCHTPIIIPYEMIPALPSKSAGQPPQPEIGRCTSFKHKRYQVDGHGKFSIVENSDLERSMKILWKMMVVVISS